MNVYLNRISHSEVHFRNISDYWAEILDLKSYHGKRAEDLIQTLETMLGSLLLDDEPDEGAVRFIRIYLEACQNYPDAEVTCDAG